MFHATDRQCWVRGPSSARRAPPRWSPCWAARGRRARSRRGACQPSDRKVRCQNEHRYHHLCWNMTGAKSLGSAQASRHLR
eukprot:931292-Prymnesium_polylepis.1